MLYFNTEFAEISYHEELNAIMCIWKKKCSNKDYREPIEQGLELVYKNNINNWIIDTTHGFENEMEDNIWIYEEFIPRATLSPCKRIIFIVKNDSKILNEIKIQGNELRKFFEVDYCESLEDVIGLI